MESRVFSVAVRTGHHTIERTPVYGQIFVGCADQVLISRRPNAYPRLGLKIRRVFVPENYLSRA